MAWRGRLSAMLAEAREELVPLEADWRQEGRDSWHSYCTDMWLTKQRAIYGWIRRETPEARAEAADLPPRGSAAVLARLDAYWQGLWQAPPEQLALADWTAPLSELEPTGDLPYLTADMLATVVRATGKTKAPGSDGCTYAHMALWPMEVYEALAAFL